MIQLGGNRAGCGTGEGGEGGDGDGDRNLGEDKETKETKMKSIHESIYVTQLHEHPEPRLKIHVF